MRFASIIMLGLASSPAAASMRSDDQRDADVADALALVRADEARRCDVFERAARSVVCIFNAGEPRTGGGSGVIISPDGLGLSNYHVVADFLDSRRGVGGLSDGKIYPLHVLGIDPGGDIVVFKLEGRAPFDFAPLGDSDQLRVGEWVAAMGNPFLVAEDYSPTLTLGIVSGLHRYQEGQENLLEYADCIQVSTSINPGNSGGPLFDLQGRLVGINGRASFEERGRVNVGLGYAVSINQIKRFLPGLRAGRLMQHGTLGAVVRPSGDNLIIGAVQDFSPAEQAGVQLGDELIAISGRPLRSGNDFNNALAILPARWPVRLSVRRDGTALELAARLEAMPLRASLVYPTDPHVNRAEITRLFSHHRGPLGTDAQPALVEFTARVTAENENEPAMTVRVVHDPSAARLTLSPTGEPPLEITANPRLTAESSQQMFWNEWVLLAAPLLATPQLDDEWEALGGDELDGRIVAVVQRRLADGAGIRWYFDFETGALRQVLVSYGENQEPVIWTPENTAAAGPRTWPARWTRRTGRDRATLDLLEWSQRPPTTQPVSTAPASSAPTTTQPGANP